ncbi:hypothetical protein Cantr_01304 [Candida viswanathii]|uniref:SNARE-complex protein Syntaxin-18 N-terminal domain-containing protein n=1 Tax=Candida viswanathii TaxID=5486 RepID=A0A367YHU7_9ASCO|nr:hypothetical protein Cantr_01304 [Candida viswanathii]
MADLTPLFKQCVDIVQSEYKSPPSTKGLHNHHTFVQESQDFYNIITNLNQFINEIKSNYLAINDDTKVSGSLSIEDKNKMTRSSTSKSSRCTSN